MQPQLRRKYCTQIEANPHKPLWTTSRRRTDIPATAQHWHRMLLNNSVLPHTGPPTRPSAPPRPCSGRTSAPGCWSTCARCPSPRRTASRSAAARHSSSSAYCATVLCLQECVIQAHRVNLAPVRLLFHQHKDDNILLHTVQTQQLRTRAVTTKWQPWRAEPQSNVMVMQPA